MIKRCSYCTVFKVIESFADYCPNCWNKLVQRRETDPNYEYPRQTGRTRELLHKLNSDPSLTLAVHSEQYATVLLRKYPQFVGRIQVVHDNDTPQRTVTKKFLLDHCVLEVHSWRWLHRVGYLTHYKHYIEPE